MSSTILVVIVLVVMWLVVLVPMFVRRTDAAEDGPAADGQPSAARVLVRRGPEPEHVVPPEPADSRARMLARRRRVFTGLVAGAVLGPVAALLVSRALWFIPMLSVVLLGGYVALVRLAARRDPERPGRQAAESAPVPRTASQRTATRGRPDLSVLPPLRGQTVVGLDDDDPTLAEIDHPFTEVHERPRAVNG